MSVLVSVVIPTYNRASIVARTIQNVLNQTYPNLELIVVDDGSTDNTISVLRGFGERIRIIQQENAGPAAARNRGLAVANGEVIAFQDSDDSWEPTKLERQVSLLRQAGSSVACCLCNARLLYSGREAITSFQKASFNPEFNQGLWTNVPEVLATNFLLFNQCAAIRTSVLRSLGGYNESMRLLEDTDLAVRLAFASPTWAYIRDPLVTWQEGSPYSLVEGAARRMEAVRKYQIEVREWALAKAEATPGYTSISRLLARELKHDRRELSLLHFAKHQYGGKWLSRVLWSLERLRIGLVRRVFLPSRQPKFISLDSRTAAS